jgi:hypothetical protein
MEAASASRKELKKAAGALQGVLCRAEFGHAPHGREVNECIWTMETSGEQDICKLKRSMIVLILSKY